MKKEKKITIIVIGAVLVLTACGVTCGLAACGFFDDPVVGVWAGGNTGYQLLSDGTAYKLVVRDDGSINKTIIKDGWSYWEFADMYWIGNIGYELTETYDGRECLFTTAAPLSMPMWMYRVK